MRSISVLAETATGDRMARDARLAKMLAIAWRHDHTLPIKLQARLGPRPGNDEVARLWGDMIDGMLANSGYGDLRGNGFEDWLARLYSTGVIDYEDIGGEALDAMGTWRELSLRGRLRAEHQDFNRMRGLKELQRIRNVPEYRAEMARIMHAVELDRHRRNRRELVLIDDDRFRVIIPMNWGACYTFNMQTGHISNFCTGGSDGLRWFQNYAPDGMIVSIADKENIDRADGKWQFHSPTNQLVNSEQQDRGNLPLNDSRFAQLFPGLMRRIVSSIEAHASEINDMSREIPGLENRGYDVASDVARIKRKFPASYASEDPQQEPPAGDAAAEPRQDLRETITDDAALNAEIERRLALLPADQRTPVLDALEVLMMAGQPITVADWAQRLRNINQDPDMEVGNTLKAAARGFPTVISRTAPGTYQWRVVRSADDEVIDPELSAQLGGQVSMINGIMDIMRGLGTWTLPELAAGISTRLGLPPAQGRAIADHVISTFGSMLDRQAGGYRLRDEAPADRDTNMRLLRGLAQRPGGGDRPA